MPKIKVTPTNPFGLSFKEKAFADIYIENKGNGTQAILQAGYNTTADVADAMASQNLGKLRVANYLADKLSAADATSEYVITNLLEDSQNRNEPIVRTKSLELIGKYLKMFTDKVDHTHVLEKVKAIGWNTRKKKREEKAKE